MGHWVKILAIIAVGASVAGVHPDIAVAGLDGHTYTSDQHQVSFQRPDRSWELREGIPLPSAVAAFVVGDGTAAAVLLHLTLSGDELITDPANLASRKSALADLIAQAATDQKVAFDFALSEFLEDGQQIKFTLFFVNRDQKRGSLENWVSGFIVRGAKKVQHVYAVRCAVTTGTFQAWESQFERITPTVQYTGSASDPVYTSRPLPTWWWFAGGGVVLFVLLLLRSRGSGKEDVSRGASSASLGAGSPLDDDAAFPRPPDMHPLHTGDEVPDILRATSGGFQPEPSPPVHPDIHHTPAPPATEPERSDTSPAVAEATKPGAEIGFWTCKCGRKNPVEDPYCHRCNTDRS